LGKLTEVQPKRVVSLIASATEIICALGARDLLVGRSHECDFPPEVARLPSLTEPKFPVSGTSYDVDARVKAILQEGLSVYRVDAEKLQALRPDIIVTQDHCEVCAVSLKDVEAALCAWRVLRLPCWFSWLCSAAAIGWFAALGLSGLPLFLAFHLPELPLPAKPRSAGCEVPWRLSRALHGHYPHGRSVRGSGLG
jgi:hypothetical protein